MQYSIVNFRQLEQGISFRYDAEYFHPRALLFEKRINGLHGKTIKEYGCTVVSGPFGSSLTSDAYLRSGIPFVRISDLRDFIIDTNGLIYISRENHVRLSSSKLKIGDFVLSKVGNTIGIVSIVTPDIGECNISENNLGLRFPKECSIEERKFILAFLNSEAGQIQILRAVSGNAQPKLNVSDAELIRVPIVTPTLIKTISDIIDKAIILIGKSKQFYTQAEQILLSELGLINWKPKHRLSFVKNFSDAQTSERIDAEYFQPMYQEIVKSLSTNFHAKPIGGYDFIDVTTGQYTDEYVLPKEGKPYIRGTDLSKGTVSIESLVYIDKKKQDKSKLAEEGDVVVTRVGTIGLSARIPKECDGGTISDNLIRLRFDGKNLNSYYTAIYLGSILGRSLMIANSRGSVQQRLNQETLKKIILPIPEINIQNKIAEAVLMSDVKRKESKSLLDIAKHGVEMAIEKNEKDAQNWIDEEVKKLGVEL